MEKLVTIPLWKLKHIRDTLRIASREGNCHIKETCYDRMVCKALEYIDECFAELEKTLKKK